MESSTIINRRRIFIHWGYLDELGRVIYTFMIASRTCFDPNACFQYLLIWGFWEICWFLKSLLVGTLFGWSRIWGFTQCFSIFYFMQSVSIPVWFVCICFEYSVHHCECDVLSLMKISITYQKKKKEIYIYIPIMWWQI